MRRAKNCQARKFRSATELQNHPVHIVCADDYLVLSQSLDAFARSYSNAGLAPPADLEGHVLLSEQARSALLDAGIVRRTSAAVAGI